MRLHTFGGLRLEGVAFRRPKPLLLVAYLALEGRQERRHTAELFWPEVPDPMKSLTVALARLRKGAEGAVGADRQHVWSTVESDAATFLAHLERDAFQEGLALYQAPFVEGFYLPGLGLELEEWVYQTREFLAAHARKALLELARQDAAQAAFERAAKRAEAAYLLPSAPEPEPEELGLLHTLLCAGDSRLARKVYDEAQAFGIDAASSKDAARHRLSRAAHTVAPKTGHNLPARASALVGRDLELTEAATWLSQTDCRLLTLLGPPGVGKTRLALQVALEQLRLNSFHDGIYLVPLESLTASHLIPKALADSVGIELGAKDEPLKKVREHIGQRRMLLVFDNFEHVIDGAVMLAELLTFCPNLTVLVTSRERLNLLEEQSFTMAGLPFPTDVGLGPEDVMQYDAVKLFVQRAKRARPDFELTEADASDVVRICRLVEGLPLGLELSAVWMRAMTAKDIAAEIARNLDFLATGTRNIPERHRSLKGAFEHSWQLLASKEQQVLRALAVFRGGFRRDAAGDVAGATIPVLASLVDKSLLRVSPGGRYDCHPLLHEFIREKLAEDEEEQIHVLDRHLATYLALAEKAAPELSGDRLAAWLDRLGEEYDNMLAALRYAETSDRLELGLRLAAALWLYWSARGPFGEGREHLTRLLTLAGSEPPTRARAKALQGAGSLARQQGDPASARTLFEQSLAVSRELGDEQGIGASLFHLGSIVAGEGDYAGARALYEESLAIARRLGFKPGIGSTLHRMGLVAYSQGDYAAARSMLEESLTIGRTFGYKQGIAATLFHLGRVAHSQGDYLGARLLLQESLAVHREVGFKPGIAETLDRLGLLSYEQGDLAAAQALHAESLDVSLKLGDRPGVAGSLEGFARLAAAAGQAERASRLWGAAGALREAPDPLVLPDERSRREQEVGEVRARLGEAEFSAAWSEGQAMTLEEAAASALAGAAAGVRQP